MVALFHNGRKMRAEAFADATCQINTLADADPRDLQALNIAGAPALSLWRLCDAATQAAKRGQTTTRYVSPPREKTAAFRQVQYAQADARENRLAGKMVAELNGYPALRRVFRIERACLRPATLLPPSLQPNLRSLTPRLVDAAQWYDPIVNKRPRYDWNDFVRIHGQVEQVAARHSWLYDWKQAGPAPGSTQV